MILDSMEFCLESEAVSARDILMEGEAFVELGVVVRACRRVTSEERRVKSEVVVVKRLFSGAALAHSIALR